MGLPRWLNGRRILPPMQEMQKTKAQSLGQEDSLDEDIATHSGTVAWNILWTEGPGGLLSIELQRVRQV